MKNVFISFSSIEMVQATEICHLLEAKGFSCFIANRDLVPGKEYAEQLVDNMSNSGVVVLLLSQASNSSPHVLREIEYAVSHKIPILVYKLEEVVLSKSMEYFLMTHQWIADAPNKEELLVESVSTIINKTEGSSKPLTTVQASPKKSKDFKKHLAIGTIIALVLVIIVLCIVMVKLFNKVNTLEAASFQASQALEASVEEVEEIEEPVEYQVGDTITLGTYYDAPIEWRVLKKNDDETLTLVSKYLLTMKAYDAPEGGEYNEYDGVDYGTADNHVVTDEALLLLIRGNNDWSKCNLRTWLNSDEEVVNYPDFPPTYKALGLNYYNTEPGFLHSFTEDEKAAMVTVPVKSPANTFSENAANGYVTSQDKVYILSSEELDWFDQAGMSMYAAPSEECKAHDEYINSYNIFVKSFHTESYYYWLRDNDGQVINKVYVTTTENVSSERYVTEIVGGSIGVRPVITVDPGKLPK